MAQLSKHLNTRPTTILLIEDEVHAQRLVKLNLEPLGYRVLILDTAAGIAEALEIHQPDLILLDLQLPDGNGLTVCTDIRAVSTVPIIVLSASAALSIKVRALEAGADDYLTKPYDPAEFAARVEAVLRRRHNRAVAPPSIFTAGPLRIDFEQHLVTLHNKDIVLTGTEYRLLKELVLHGGRTLVADAVLSKVWGQEYTGDYASLHLYISRLRHKLGERARNPRFIITKSGIGYAFNMGPYPEEESDTASSR